MNVKTSIIKLFLVVCILIPYVALAEVKSIDVNLASDYISTNKYILASVGGGGWYQLIFLSRVWDL